jgi:hypothetical protein
LSRSTSSVVDKDGNPVTGLTKEDFVILDRKKPQTIEVFEEFKYNAKEAAMKPGAFPPQLKLDFSSNQSAQSARLILMVIDDLHIYKERTSAPKRSSARSLPILARSRRWRCCSRRGRQHRGHPESRRVIGCDRHAERTTPVPAGRCFLTRSAAATCRRSTTTSRR